MCRIMHFELVVDLDHLRRMIDAAPAHVGDVQQTVDTAQVDKRTEVGDVLDHALGAVAPTSSFLEQFALALSSLGFDQAADD